MLVFFVSVVVGFIIFKLLFDAVLFNGRYYFKKRYEKALRMHELKAIQETDLTSPRDAFVDPSSYVLLGFKKDRAEAKKVFLVLRGAHINITDRAYDFSWLKCKCCCYPPVSVENCIVHVERAKAGKIHRLNAIRVTHDSKPILLERYYFYLFFFNGYDMEYWYQLISRLVDPISYSSLVNESNQLDAYIKTFIPTLTKIREGVGGENQRDYVQADLAAVNAFLDRYFFYLHELPAISILVQRKLDKKFTKIRKPEIIKRIYFHSMTVGTNIPLLTNLDLVYFDEMGKLEFDFGFNYRGGLCITVVVEFKFKEMTIPVRVRVKVKHASGDLRALIMPFPCRHMWIGFHKLPDFDFDVDVTFFGINIALNLVPFLQEIIKYIVLVELMEDFLLPNMDDVTLPKPDAPETGENEDDEENESTATEQQQSAGSATSLESRTVFLPPHLRSNENEQHILLELSEEESKKAEKEKKKLEKQRREKERQFEKVSLSGVESRKIRHLPSSLSRKKVARESSAFEYDDQNQINVKSNHQQKHDRHKSSLSSDGTGKYRE